MTRGTQWSFAGVLVAIFVAQLGCAHWSGGGYQGNLAEDTLSIEPREYGKIYRKWTRELYIIPINGVENVLTAKATFLSSEFRAAYIARVSEDLRYSPSERATLRKQQLQALSQQHEFFVSVMSGLERSDELDPERGDWLIRLEDDRGRRLLPTAVTEVKKPNYTEVKSFDFDPVHRTAYRVTFPTVAEDGQPLLTDATQFFILSFSSSMGQGEMRWDTERNR